MYGDEDPGIRRGKRGKSMRDDSDGFNWGEWATSGAKKYWGILMALSALGILMNFFLALDGRNCKPGFNILNEDSHARTVGCFVRGLVKMIPDNVRNDPGLEPSRGTRQPTELLPPAKPE